VRPPDTASAPDFREPRQASDKRAFSETCIRHPARLPTVEAGTEPVP